MLTHHYFLDVSISYYSKYVTYNMLSESHPKGSKNYPIGT